jgi:hypothetical protein
MLVLSQTSPDVQIPRLLHRPNAKPRAARVEAWEGKDPGSIRVLLARWEKRLLRFLGLSGVGRVVEDGTDIEEARAARLDEWIVWGAEERLAQEAHN